MDMKTARLANAFWLSISDRQVVALRTAWLSRDGSAARPDASAANEPRRLPMLDWPESLFDNEISCQ
ncbi:MAG: hypothetical protein QOD93_7452 [Acetobacteraceae bacterium]|nr:hypothetical protein [Acetobacteraceae bacterium]